jgi:hypothetical protein
MARLLPYLQARRRLVAAAILLVGAAAALALLLAAGSDTGNPYGSRPEDSKSYLRQMELYGGKANVLASEIREWFNGLWHGRALARTVACLSALLSAVAWVALRPPMCTSCPPGSPPRDREASGSP